MENFDMTTFNYSTTTPKEQKVFRDWLTSHLKYGPVTVDFLKKDGTMRTMKCTLLESAVPTYEKIGAKMQEGITAADIVTNEFIDPTIALP